MKRTIILCALSWSVLAGLVFGLYSYALRLEVVMQAPTALLLKNDDRNLVVKWDHVEYATSYRIYKADNEGKWQLLKAVGYNDHQYVLPDDCSIDGNYAVRSCNKSVIKTSLSDYSNAVFGE